MNFDEDLAEQHRSHSSQHRKPDTGRDTQVRGLIRQGLGDWPQQDLHDGDVPNDHDIVQEDDNDRQDDGSEEDDDVESDDSESDDSEEEGAVADSNVEEDDGTPARESMQDDEASRQNEEGQLEDPFERANRLGQPPYPYPAWPPTPPLFNEPAPASPSPYCVPYNFTVSSQLFAKPEHSRWQKLPELKWNHRETLMRYFPRDINGPTLLDVAGVYTDAAIAKALNVARAPDDQIDGQWVNRQIFAAYCLYGEGDMQTKILRKDSSDVDKREHHSLKDFHPPDRDERYYNLALVYQCAMAVLEWLVANEPPQWLLNMLKQLSLAVVASMKGKPQQATLMAMLKQRKNDCEGALRLVCHWVDRGFGDPIDIIKYLWPSVMQSLAYPWRKGEITILNDLARQQRDEANRRGEEQR